jgi:hypothetical protein
VRRRRVHGLGPPSSRSFVTAALIACLGLLAATLALNVVVDPFAIARTGIVPSAVENDRAIKLDLIDRLKVAPGILVLGSSRARQAEPAQLEKLTGRKGFNAAVTGGTASDAWVMTRYVADRFPTRNRGYIWFVDVGIATNGVNPQLAADSRSDSYLPGGSGFGPGDVKTYLGTDATAASFRVVRSCVLASCEPRLRYGPDGSLTGATLRYLPEQTDRLRQSVDELVASIRKSPPAAGSTSPERYTYFERTLAFMNGQGSRPVIVLNPIHPEVLAELQRHGFPARKASMAYLDDLRRRFDFVLVDAQDISRWGGSPADFSNATHVNRRNMRRMLAYVVARAEGALKQGSAG